MSRYIKHVILIGFLSILCFTICIGQNTYSLDLEFSENVGDLMFRGSANRLFIEDNGKIVVSGDFDQYPNFAGGITRLHSNGIRDISFSFLNNSGSAYGQAIKHNGYYFFGNKGCIMLDGTPCDSATWYNKYTRPPFAGTFTPMYRPVSYSDTTLVIPGRNRINIEDLSIFNILIGLGPHGDALPTFPSFHAQPITSVAREIEAIPGGGYYLVGRWQSVNGYESPSIIKLTESFEIDTTFNSPFTAASISTVSVDSVGRAWFSAANVYSDTYQDADLPLLRLNLDGTIDTTFNIPNMSPYFTEWFSTPTSVISVVDDGSGFVIGGAFGSVNEQQRLCIAKLSESGELLPDFADIDLMRAYYHAPSTGDTTFSPPAISHLVISPEGNLLVTGKFNDVGNATCHNIMQFNPTPLSSLKKADPFKAFGIYPNPSKGLVRISYEAKAGTTPQYLRLYDLSGRNLLQKQLPSIGENALELVLNNLNSGMYIIELSTQDGQSARKKLIIQNEIR